MNEERFRGLFADNFTDVWRFARRRTASGTDADDVVAETFAVAWRRRDDVPIDAALLWLFGVARNVLANHHRELGRRGRLHLRLALTDATPVGYHDPPAASEELLWPALAALSDGDRELLLLRAWEGLGVGEIATVLGVSPANVSSRLHKARQRLSRELERRDPLSGGHVQDESRRERSDLHDRI
jgi:RNA polymerase sigma factor (sigma-70 family)